MIWILIFLFTSKFCSKQVLVLSLLVYYLYIINLPLAEADPSTYEHWLVFVAVSVVKWSFEYTNMDEISTEKISMGRYYWKLDNHILFFIKYLILMIFDFNRMVNSYPAHNVHKLFSCFTSKQFLFTAILNNSMYKYSEKYPPNREKLHTNTFLSMEKFIWTWNQQLIFLKIHYCLRIKFC